MWIYWKLVELSGWTKDAPFAPSGQPSVRQTWVPMLEFVEVRATLRSMVKSVAKTPGAESKNSSWNQNWRRKEQKQNRNLFGVISFLFEVVFSHKSNFFVLSIDALSPHLFFLPLVLFELPFKFGQFQPFYSTNIYAKVHRFEKEKLSFIGVRNAVIKVIDNLLY